jgi:purine-binding chemotaxis protein CheW
MPIDTGRNATQPGDVLQYVSFYLGEALFGVPIEQVDEINRHLALTPVPHAPAYVRGVINLRGDVVSVVDLRAILGMETATITRSTRNVIVHYSAEHIGLVVDRVADVVTVRAKELDSPPANMRGAAGRYYGGVYKLDHALMVVLDVTTLLSINTIAA